MDSRNPSDRGGARFPPLGPTQELTRLAFPPETSYAHWGPPGPQLDLAQCRGAVPAGKAESGTSPKWDEGAVVCDIDCFPIVFICVSGFCLGWPPAGKTRPPTTAPALVGGGGGVGGGGSLTWQQVIGGSQGEMVLRVEATKVGNALFPQFVARAYECGNLLHGEVVCY
jgi:hypothetical protein